MNPQLDCDLIAIDRRKELDTARASEAMLRVTLSDINAYLNDPETTIAEGDQIENVLNAIDTILSGSSGEWLERHDAEIVTAISRDKNAALARAEKAEAERDALLGNPKAVHQGALAAIEAMKQMQGNAEKIQALQNEAATAGIRLAMVEAERDRRIGELEALLKRCQPHIPPSCADLEACRPGCLLCAVDAALAGKVVSCG